MSKVGRAHKAWTTLARPYIVFLTFFVVSIFQIPLSHYIKISFDKRHDAKLILCVCKHDVCVFVCLLLDPVLAHESAPLLIEVPAQGDGPGPDHARDK